MSEDTETSTRNEERPASAAGSSDRAADAEEQRRELLEKLRREREVGRDLRDELFRMEGEVEKAVVRVREAEAEREEAQDQVARLEESLREQREGHQAELKTANTQRETAERDLARGLEEREGLSAEIDTARGVISSLRAERDDLAADRDRLAVRVTELESGEEAAQRQQDKQAEELAEHRKKLEAEVRAEQKKLRSETEAFRKKLLREVQIVRGETGKQIADLERERDKLAERMEKEIERTAERERKIAERDHRKRLATLEATLEDLQEAMDEVEAENERLARAAERRDAQESETPAGPSHDEKALTHRLQVALEAQNDLLEALEEEQVARAETETELALLKKRTLVMERDLDERAAREQEMEDLQSNYEMVQAMLSNAQGLLETREKELLNALKQIGKLRREVKEAKVYPVGDLTADSLTAVGGEMPIPAPTEQDWATHDPGTAEVPAAAAYDTDEHQRLVPGNQVFTANLDDYENDDDTFVRRLSGMFKNR